MKTGIKKQGTHFLFKHKEYPDSDCSVRAIGAKF